MLNYSLILLGKIVLNISKFSNFGSGSTWPGHIALQLDSSFIKNLIKNNPNLKFILIAGTNGKTTTGKLIQNILEKDGKKVFQNKTGANLLNGIASSLILNSKLNGKINKDFAIFEIDENTLPLILKEIPNPNYIVLLNLFRDQLDRYGEVNTVASKWKNAIQYLPSKTTLILNADDPQIAYLGKNHKNTYYFGVKAENPQNNLEHASDSIYCPKCNSKLIYKSIVFSHLGNWNCTNCLFKHPDLDYLESPLYPLIGTYNMYNTNAAVLLSTKIGLNMKTIVSALKNFTPAFGRQEKITIKDKYVQILLSKNPTSLNECIRTASDMQAKNLLIILNDRIPDGRDISWIWDVDFENFSSNFNCVAVSGDRTHDMALRLKYANYKNVKIYDNLTSAIDMALENTKSKDTLYILTTYSAMLETRKILTGKKIL